MRFPNKVISYNESIISKFPLILELLQKRDYAVAELFDKIKMRVDIEDYMDALDSLYALGRIEINTQTRRIHYVI